MFYVLQFTYNIVNNVMFSLSENFKWHRLRQRPYLMLLHDYMAQSVGY